jgi:hypothetical protein
MSDRPLGEVLARAFCDFYPQHPEREPWQQPTPLAIEFAVTDNRVTVPLQVADRVKLQGLDQPTFERDYLEPFDWTPAGWGVSP